MGINVAKNKKKVNLISSQVKKTGNRMKGEEKKVSERENQDSPTEGGKKHREGQKAV